MATVQTKLVTTQYVELAVSDGTRMRAYTARPETATPHAGLLVFQEAFGVNAHIRDVAERFARQGFVAIAPELFHRTAPGFEGEYSNFAAVMPHLQAMTPQSQSADIHATFDWLRSDSAVREKPIASVGFCMGGTASFLANAVVPVKAAISFYGGGIAPGSRGPGLLSRASELHAPTLLFWGGLDKSVGPDQNRAVVDALRAAGKPFVNVEFSDADHGFFCDVRPSHNAVAAAQSWALSLEFLKSHLH